MRAPKMKMMMRRMMKRRKRRERTTRKTERKTKTSRVLKGEVLSRIQIRSEGKDND